MDSQKLTGDPAQMGFRASKNQSDGFGGAEGIRTPDPHNAIVVLYQLSYDPNQSPQNLENSHRLSKGFFPRLHWKSSNSQASRALNPLWCWMFS